MKKLSYYVKKELPLFIGGLIAMVGTNITQLIIPLFIGEFIDLITKENYDEIWYLCSKLLIFVAVSLHTPKIIGFCSE